MLESSVRAILAARGMAEAGFAFDVREWAGVDGQAVLDAALRCKAEADLRVRLWRLQRPRRP